VRGVFLNMRGLGHIGDCGADWAKAMTVLLVLAMPLAACATTQHASESEQAAVTTPPPPPPPPPPPQPPPVDLAGKWKLSVAGGGACVMTLGDVTGAAEGTVAPAGGCPGSFFTSRKWTFEHDKLAIRDHKGAVLTELSFAGGRFQGQGPGGAATTLAR
jgi:protease inhibitor Inh